MFLHFCTAPWDPGIARNHTNSHSILQFRVSTKSWNQSYPCARFRVRAFSGNTKTRIRYVWVFTFREIVVLQSGRRIIMVSCEKWVAPGGAKVRNHTLFLRNNVWFCTFTDSAEGAFCSNSHWFLENNVISCEVLSRPGTMFLHQTIWITISKLLFAIPQKAGFHSSRGCVFRIPTVLMVGG